MEENFVSFFDVYSIFWGQEGFRNDPEPFSFHLI